MSWKLEDSARKERQGKEQGFPLKTEATAQRVTLLVSRGSKENTTKTQRQREREKETVRFI